MSSAPIDTWDLVRAWGYEVVYAERLQADAYIADDEPIVIVRAPLSPERSEAVAWDVMARLPRPSRRRPA